MADYDASLVKWYENQMPKVAKKLALKGLDTPPLHIGGKVKIFSPRIPYSPADGEDLTIPRVCCSLALKNCIIGARHNFRSLDIQQRIHIYAFDERSVVQPSVDVTKEPNRAGEVWIVPHRMANWEIKPKVLGEMRLVMLSHDSSEFMYAVQVGETIAFDSSKKLEAGQTYLIRITIKMGEVTNVTDPELTSVDHYHGALNAYTVAS
ncbi:hypothetical protein BIZ83_gp022 [Erwinia phage vB_EamM_ChrisDB]|uniref:hypothetical protein n=1 Tax=Erwinia phage vB_EamM_ChrisDB TaxID=1883371 RepID=UPI00081CEFBB|nr:hypothetical protein BIZ83_gp022 [Erwinia phage vB_EamM_ChrisDB]ANZ48831.1 hypothetical protein CHRISDB_269 [Erwinia phage vB_EamM_ChrisDB]